MPKFNGTYLYYVESIRNQYILKRTDFSNTVKITKRGVVYNYDFIAPGKVGIIYSDFITPRTWDIHTNSLNLQIGFHLLTSSILKMRRASIILNFHPGLHSDFSPRWDSTLIALLSHGYIIVSPNYPMSKGYGKTYNTASFNDAVSDMISWKNFVKKQYNGLPLYYLAASSGNLLMEECLETDQEGVAKAVSLFGLFRRTSYSFTVPVLYVLGKNDPKVNYVLRKFSLNSTNKTNISVIEYEDEGHWFRKRENLKDALSKLLCFLEN